jgi:hypothetical protein
VCWAPTTTIWLRFFLSFWFLQKNHVAVCPNTGCIAQVTAGGVPVTPEKDKHGATSAQVSPVAGVFAEATTSTTPAKDTETGAKTAGNADDDGDDEDDAEEQARIETLSTAAACMTLEEHPLPARVADWPVLTGWFARTDPSADISADCYVQLEGIVLVRYKSLKHGLPHKPLGYFVLTMDTAITYGGDEIKLQSADDEWALKASAKTNANEWALELRRRRTHVMHSVELQQPVMPAYVIAQQAEAAVLERRHTLERRQTHSSKSHQAHHADDSTGDMRRDSLSRQNSLLSHGHARTESNAVRKSATNTDDEGDDGAGDGDGAASSDDSNGENTEGNMPKLSHKYIRSQAELTKQLHGFVKLAVTLLNNVLTVKVLEGRGIPPCDMNGLADPYVKWCGLQRRFLIVCDVVVFVCAATCSPRPKKAANARHRCARRPFGLCGTKSFRGTWPRFPLRYSPAAASFYLVGNIEVDVLYVGRGMRSAPLRCPCGTKTRSETTLSDQRQFRFETGGNQKLGSC